MRTGERIADRRQRLGLSQTALAKAAGLSQATIGKLEAGISSGSSHLHRIARELQTTSAYLTGESDDPDLNAPPPAPPATIQFINMPVALPAQPALEQMFEGLLRSMPDVGRGELAHELAKLLPIGLAQLQGPLRYVTTGTSDDAGEDPSDCDAARPARRRASRK